MQFITLHNLPYSKKLWWSKSLVKRDTASHWWKKLWWMLTYIANRPSLINSKQSRTKQFQTSMNIIKQTPYFPFVLCHVLVACCLMMARWTVQSIIRGYHEYISKLLLETELDLKILQYHYVSVPQSLCKTH